MPLKTYSIYTQCPHCGVYDRDAAWCDLCGRSKETSTRRALNETAPRAEDRVPPAPEGAARHV